LIADRYGGVVSDLDVLPLRPLDEIVGSSPYVFDRCSRKHIIANDFFYVGEKGLPDFARFFSENIRRVDSIAVYETWRMRYVFESTGPSAFTRYLKWAALAPYKHALSDRTFLDPKERRRDVKTHTPFLKVIHHLSWADHVRR